MHVWCCEGLFYKYRHIRYNLCLQVQLVLIVHFSSAFRTAFQTKQYDQCCALFKELSAHELKYKFNDDDQNYLFMIDIVLGLRPTAAALKKLSHDQVMMMVMAPLAFGFSPDEHL